MGFVSRFGYSWKEMTIVMLLAKQIDAVKLQYTRHRTYSDKKHKIINYEVSPR